MKRVITENLKRIFTALTFDLIIMTLILAPVGYQGSQSAYAQESKPGIYQVDSQFNKDLSKTDIKSVADASSNSIVKIVEQYVAAMFGVVMISSLNHKYTMRSRVDCPMNRTADVTLRLVQLSSLIYILTDIRANMMFEEASKIAVDKNFTAKKEVVKTDSKKLNAQSQAHENKQIAAYDALIKIYKKQEAALKTKLTGAAISEAGYITSLVLEYKGAAACQAICKTSFPVVQAQFARILTTELPMQTKYATARAAQRTTEKRPKAAAACTAVATQLPAYISKESVILKKLNVVAKTEASGNVSFWMKTKAKFVSMWNSAMGGVKSALNSAGDTLNSAKDSGKSFFNSDELPTGIAVLEDKKDNVKGTKNEVEAKKTEVSLETMRTNLHTQAQACDPQFAFQLKSRLDKLSKAKATFTKSVKEIPIFCCGSNKTIPVGKNGKITGVKRIKFKSLANNKAYEKVLMKGKFNSLTTPIDATAYQDAAGKLYQPTLADPIPFPSIMSSKVDVLFKGFSFGGGKKTSSLMTPHQGMSNEEIIREVTKSFLNTIAFEKVYKNLKSEDPEKALKKIASTHRYINEILDNQNQIESQPEFIEMKNILAENGVNSPTSQKYFQKTVQSLSDLVIAPAQAGGLWSQLLNIGVKLAALQFFLGKYVREYGLVKPYNRQWTWGIMSAVNGGLMFFNMKSLKEASERRKRVEAEKKRFMDSSAISSGLVKENGNEVTSTSNLSSGGSDKDYSPSNVIKTCVVAQGDRLIPSKVCPSSGIKKTADKNKLSKAVIKSAGPNVMGALNFVNAQAVETSENDNGNGGFSSGTLEKAQSILKALRPQKDAVLKQADKAIAKNPFYKKGNIPTLSSSISSGLRNLPNSQGGNTISSFKASPIAKTEKDGEEKIEDGSSQLGGTAITSGTVSFDGVEEDLDLDMDSEPNEIADVNPKDEVVVDNNEYVYNHDIHENEDVSIFKIISNRAIKYYPVLLEKDE